MSVVGIAITTTTQIIPTFLLAVGVGSAVHILSIFYQAIARDEETVKRLISAPGLDGEEPPLGSEELREVASRLPLMQAELRTLRARRAPVPPTAR